jgi:hypothetical protein
MSSRRIVRGYDGPVEIDETLRTVTKIYAHPDPGSAVAKAAREILFASRLHEALAPIEGLDCPRVLDWDLGAPPRVIMALCPGEPLSGFLARLSARDLRIPVIAARIRDGLAVYVRVFGEPYYDLCFQNLLYEEATGLLTFLDFGIPERLAGPAGGSALEMSLGNLVGWACYDMVRPSRLLRAKGAYREVAHSVVKAFSGSVSEKRVDALARATFRRLGNAGTIARRSYYGTAGAALCGLHLRGLSARRS